MYTIEEASSPKEIQITDKHVGKTISFNVFYENENRAQTAYHYTIILSYEYFQGSLILQEEYPQIFNRDTERPLLCYSALEQYFMNTDSVLKLIMDMPHGTDINVYYTVDIQEIKPEVCNRCKRINILHKYNDSPFPLCSKCIKQLNDDELKAAQVELDDETL